jgi:DNA (cytosine-5)-methyltransferase 1
VNVLDLFSGIGGFSLGLERAGMKTVAFCEIDPFCRKILKKHWPKVPCYDDVRTLTAERLSADGISVDVICGGFPCQDLSAAGLQKGIIKGEKSGLWGEFSRLIGEFRPKFIIVENVTALLSGECGYWFSEFLSSLAVLGYDAEWHCIRASTIGLPHRRDRVRVIANPTKNGSINDDPFLNRNTIEMSWKAPEAIMGNPSWEWLLLNGDMRDYRKHDGLPQAAYRIGSCGNAVVPQIPELIGRAIMESL